MAAIAGIEIEIVDFDRDCRHFFEMHVAPRNTLHCRLCYRNWQKKCFPDFPSRELAIFGIRIAVGL